MKAYVRTGLTWSALMIAVMVGIVVWGMNALPEGPVPLHWGPDGLPDRFGSREEAALTLWILPAVGLGITLILAVMPSLDPRKRNIDTGRTAYVTVWIAVMVLMAALTGGIALAMTGSQEAHPETIRYIIAGVSLLMVILGNLLPKTRPNFSFGIRTPWTLSNDNVWERTHRLGGPLLMLAGLIGLAGAFLAQGIWLAFALAGPAMAAVLISVVYSYLAWRRETGAEQA